MLRVALALWLPSFALLQGTARGPQAARQRQRARGQLTKPVVTEASFGCVAEAASEAPVARSSAAAAEAEQPCSATAPEAAPAVSGSAADSAPAASARAMNLDEMLKVLAADRMHATDYACMQAASEATRVQEGLGREEHEEDPEVCA